MVTQYFTFGLGTVFANVYIKLQMKTDGDCRKEMFSLFGDNWSMQYDNRSDFDKDCKLVEMPIITNIGGYRRVDLSVLGFAQELSKMCLEQDKYSCEEVANVATTVREKLA